MPGERAAHSVGPEAQVPGQSTISRRVGARRSFSRAGCGHRRSHSNCGIRPRLRPGWGLLGGVAVHRNTRVADLNFSRSRCPCGAVSHGPQRRHRTRGRRLQGHRQRDEALMGRVGGRGCNNNLLRQATTDRLRPLAAGEAVAFEVEDLSTDRADRMSPDEHVDGASRLRTEQEHGHKQGNASSERALTTAKPPESGPGTHGQARYAALKREVNHRDSGHDQRGSPAVGRWHLSRGDPVHVVANAGWSKRRLHGEGRPRGRTAIRLSLKQDCFAFL